MRVLLSLLLLPAAFSASATADWPGRPQSPPPKLHQSGPPPSWIETNQRSTWLAFGSYCWTTMCVDMIPPAMRKDLPTVTITRGAPVRVHLAFIPRSGQAFILRGGRQTTVKLRSNRVLVWRPRIAGVVLVDVKGEQGSAGYFFRLRIRAT